MQKKKMLAKVLSVSVLAAVLTSVPLPTFAQTMLEAGFESGYDGFGPRSSETVDRVSTKAHSGEYSLYCSGRTEDWNGPVLSMGRGDWVAGETYSFSCAVYQESGSSVTMKLSLEYADATGTKNYKQIATDTVASGEWVVLSNDAYTLPSDGESMQLYIETDTDKCDFYVDDVFSGSEGSSGPSSGPVIGTPPAPTYRMGDVNHDDKIDSSDRSAVLDFILAKNDGADINTDTADINKDGKVNSVDLSMLRQFFIYPDLTSTTTTTTTTTTMTTTTKAQTPQRDPNKFTNVADTSWIKAQKVVALSFDDGPVTGGNPQRIQNALTKQGFHATFFYWGQRIAGNENEIREAEKRGFEVADHSWSHPQNWGQLDGNSAKNEYNQCKQALDKIVGEERIYLMRLPYLASNQQILSALNYVPFPNSGIDSEDWNGNSSGGIVSRVQQAAQQGRLDGQVVLMHENYDSTATAVEQLCPWLEQNGYAVVTVSEMFKFHNKELKGGKIYNSCWD